MENKVMIICSDMSVRNINGKLQIDLYDCDLSSLTIFDGNKYSVGNKKEEPKEITPKDYEKPQQELYIIDLNFSERVKNALLNNKIFTVSELCKYSKDDLKCIRQLGVASINNIIQILRTYTLKLSTKDKLK